MSELASTFNNSKAFAARLIINGCEKISFGAAKFFSFFSVVKKITAVFICLFSAIIILGSSVNGFSQVCNAVTQGGFDKTSLGFYPSINGWTAVGTDAIHIVSQAGSNAARIRNSGTEKYSLQQTLYTLAPGSTYSLNLKYGNWTSGCNTSANSRILIEVFAGSATVPFFSSEPVQANDHTTLSSITLNFTIPANTSSITIKITDPGSPPSTCGAVVDDLYIASPMVANASSTNVGCNGQNTGSFTVNASGAAAPYTGTYSKDGAAGVAFSFTGGTASVNNLPAGTYTLDIKDANACGQLITFTIVQPPPLVVTFNKTKDVSCFSGSDGGATLNVGGGTEGYSYSWTKDGIAIAAPPLGALSAGVYQVTVTDAANCAPITKTITIAQPTAALTLTSAKTDVLCFGAATGSIDLSVTGGTAPYTYAWTGGITTQDVAGLAAGAYNVTVTDANNCTATISVTITQPAAALALTLAKTDVLCFGAATGAINLSVTGGTAPYTYAWTGGLITEDISGLAAGTYNVTVTDANNCTATSSVIVTQPAALTLTSSKIDVRCFGTNTGAINLSVAGGTAPYTYAWTGGITTEDLSNLAAGTYNVTVTDVNNCTATASVTISQPASALSLSSTKTDVLCFGAATGAINLSVIGGTAPYSYAWTGGITTEDLSGLIAGTYTVTVTDANNCTAAASVIVSQPASLLALAWTQTNILCFGAATGAVNLSVTGGTAPYTYAWTGGITTEDLSSLAAGTYNVTVTDASNCTATASIIITQPAAALALTSAKTDVLCFGATTGAVDLSVTGGTAPYTYAWTGGITTQDLSGLAAGTYSVTVTDANNCTATASVVINQPAAALSLSWTKTDVLCFGASTGTINLSVSGGTAPYTFGWTGGVTTEDLSGLAAGTYSVTVTDANNCTATASVTITQPASLTLSSAKTDVICFGGTTGAVNLSVTGGTAPYTYSWTGGITTEDLSGLAAGTYSVTVTDANNCTATASVIITQPAALALSSVKTDVLCFGASTGSVNLGVTGGTAPYTYAWTGGITTEDLSGLAAGTYNVTVTDANNCTATASVVITQPAAALALTSTKTDVLCFGALTGLVNLSVTGGTAPYTYSWTGGITTEDLSNLAAGTYNVTVTDANNCTATTSVTITQPAAALALTSAKTDVLCFGATTGGINLSVTGGTAPYTYAWTGGITTEDLSGLAAGTYNVTVTDASNCTATASVIITQPAALALSSVKTDVLCFGASTGSVNLSVTGGTAPYTYAWTGGITTEDLSGLAAGTYNVTVTDANNCAATTSVTISQPVAALALTSAKTDVLCFGASTGSVNVSVTGGTAPYSYSWTGGVTTEDLSNLAAGTYNVTVTDANNCTATGSVTITQPASALALSSTKANVLCFGASTGSIDLTVSGGTAPYTYAWTGGIITEDLSSLTAGTYNVTVTDANNCTAIASIVITQPAAALALTSAKTDVLCFGAATGSIDLSVTGGTAPYSYSWTGGITTEDLSNLAAGTYNVTVTDANNCTATTSVTITQPALALALNSIKTDVLCYGATTGGINLSVSGGTAPYSYVWTSGITTEDLSSLAAGTYNVTVTDANNCTATASVVIIQPAAALTLTSAKTDVLCFGASTGSIDLSVAGGTAPYTYAWTGGVTTEDLSGLAAGTYSVTVTDANNCITTASIVITQPAAALALTSAKTDVLCFGAATGSIDLSVTGGTAPYTYAWTGGITTEDLSGLAAGTYDVTVTDANNCTAIASIVITQPAASLALTSAKTDVLCFGASTGSIDLSVAGGAAPYTYAWTGGVTTKDLSGLAAGTYDVTVTDANNCTATASVVIIQPAAALTLTSAKTDVLCFGASTGSIDLSVAGGTAPYTYAWTGGVTTEDLSGLAAGTYSVTVTDANNCTAIASIVITQPAAALALTSAKTDVLCFGAATGSIDLSVTGGTAPYSYSWTGGITTEDLSNLAAGTYNVTVTDANNCTATTSVTIIQNTALVLTIAKTDIDCYGSSTGAIDLSVSGGTAPYMYSWTAGITTEDIAGLAAGAYTVTVTDKNNCTATAMINIEQPSSALVLSFTKTDVPCFGFSNGVINLSVSGGTAPYKYSWTGGRTTEDLVGLAAGSYNVVVTDARNCTATTTIIVAQPDNLLALNASKQDVLCYGARNGSIDLRVTGGTAPYKYVWTGGKTTEDISGLAAGSYNVTVTDANNCTATHSVTISQPGAVLAVSSVKTDIICYGSSAGEINITAAGGTAPYRYAWSDGVTSEDRSGLAAGSYQVTVTDANNCTETASIVILQPVMAFTLSHTKTDVLCFGSATASIDLKVTGGYAPYTYAWDNGKNTEDLSALPAGSYSVTVRDSKGCEVKSTITVSQPENLQLAVTKSDISCYGSNTGSIFVTVKGGIAPYSYKWHRGQTTKDLTGLQPGTYKVTVTDAAKCTATADVMISQAEPLKAVLTVKNASCMNTDGAISSNITGGVKPYKISWTGNSTLSGAEITQVKSGTYEMIVTDAAGCTISVKGEILLGTCLPIAQNDEFSVEQGKVLLGDVAPNDTSPQAEKLTFTKLKNPANGMITFGPDGKFTFTPDNGFAGTVEFSYQICNASGACDTAKVSIKVSTFSIVNLTPELSSVWEGRKVAVTARLERAFNEDVTITVEYSGKAEKEKDYLVLDQHVSLTIPKGSLSTTQKMTIAALNDGFQEGDEDIIMKIKTVSSPDVRIGNGAVVIINDVYPPPPTTDVPQDEPINADIVPDPLMSPNGDGSGNEFFTIQNIESYPDNEVLIFNRWGNELFYIKNYNNTDRNFKGFANKGILVNSDLPLSDGVYFYLVTTHRTTGPERTKHVNKGYLILKR